MSSSKGSRPLRRAVDASTGRELLRSLNIKSDEEEQRRGGWKLKGNKRNMSNREIFTESPDSKHVKGRNSDPIEDIDPDKATRQPGVVPRMWSKEEDDLLREAVKRIGEKNWKAISNAVPGRNYIQCLQRWKKALKPGLRKGHWSEEEDTKLLELVNDHKPNWNWRVIADEIPGRNAKQCRERWFLNLDPSINRGPWSQDEDERLVKMVAKWDGRWSLIARYMPGRTENAVKTRFHSLKRKEARNRKWTAEEDKTIIDVALQNGKDFAKMHSLLSGRTKAQIKKRYASLEKDGAISQYSTNVTNRVGDRYDYVPPQATERPKLLVRSDESWMNGVIENIESTRPTLEKTDSTKVVAGFLKPESLAQHNPNPFIASPNPDMLFPSVVPQDGLQFNGDMGQSSKPRLQRQGSSSLRKLDSMISADNDGDLDFSKLSMDRSNSLLPNTMGYPPLRQSSVGIPPSELHSAYSFVDPSIPGRFLFEMLSTV
mmetsp:Transcript_13828/g.16207  ORF Transcript_13828/g.16207 Transcript_13828/m.16207 type:complete len:486 (-) Transcript_13828:1034-2491(-)